MARFIPCAETAKLVRAALKKAFPRVKFSVRSHTYAGGASINVEWADGPTQAMVEAVAKSYAGSRFDGMIDLKSSVDHYLMPDGRAVLARDSGTTCSAGVREPYRTFKPDPAAERVSFGADYVFCTRRVSPAMMRRAVEKVAPRYGLDPGGVEIRTHYNGSAYLVRSSTGGYDFEEAVTRDLARRCAWVPPAAA